MVKQLMRDRVRFEPKVSWLHILKREAGALERAGQAWTLSRGSHSSVAVMSTGRRQHLPPERKTRSPGPADQHPQYATKGQLGGERASELLTQSEGEIVSTGQTNPKEAGSAAENRISPHDLRQ